MFKNDFELEPYLHLINKARYLTAFARFRTGSHTLEIERGRYTNPRTPIENRLCSTCSEIEDEMHFLTKCKLFSTERVKLYEKIYKLYPDFQTYCNSEQFIF